MRIAAAEPSRLTPPGLVQHAAEVERNWFRRITGGQDLPPAHEDGTGFTLDPERGTGETLAVWRRETARGRELRAGRPLDGTGGITGGPPAGTEVSLRRVPAHVIEECARHNGA